MPLETTTARLRKYSGLQGKLCAFTFFCIISTTELSLTFLLHFSKLGFASLVRSTSTTQVTGYGGSQLKHPVRAGCTVKIQNPFLRLHIDKSHVLPPHTKQIMDYQWRVILQRLSYFVLKASQMTLKSFGKT